MGNMKSRSIRFRVVEQQHNFCVIHWWELLRSSAMSTRTASTCSAIVISFSRLGNVFWRFELYFLEDMFKYTRETFFVTLSSLEYIPRKCLCQNNQLQVKKNWFYAWFPAVTKHYMNTCMACKTLQKVCINYHRQYLWVKLFAVDACNKLTKYFISSKLVWSCMWRVIGKL